MGIEVLEEKYQAYKKKHPDNIRKFDRIAKRKRVFKVEVVGDCYVAVCGLPDPRKKHAVVMAKFAADCLAGKCMSRAIHIYLFIETVLIRFGFLIHQTHSFIFKSLY